MMHRLLRIPVRRVHSAAHTSLVQSLESHLRGIIADALPPEADKLPLLSPSRQADYQSNVCWMIGKQRKLDAKKVASLAESITARITERSDMLHATAGSGFINLSVKENVLRDRTDQLLTSPYPIFGESTLKRPDGSRVLVDFSSPNVGKQLHVGHLRSSVIGDTLSRILSYMGADVTRVSHIGDAGLPVALLIAAYLYQHANVAALSLLKAPPLELLQAAEAVDQDKTPKFTLPSVADFSSVYSKAKQTVDRQPESDFAKQSQTTLRALQAVLAKTYNPTLATHSLHGITLSEDELKLFALWRVVCSVSKAAIRPLLRDLNVNVSEKGESTYTHLLSNTVEQLLRTPVVTQSPGSASDMNGTVAVHSNDAVGVFVDGLQAPPLLLRKADGGYLYATIDVAALMERLQAGYDRVVYVTDVAQAGHFRQLFGLARMAGWVDSDGTTSIGGKIRKIRLDHAPFGVVTGANGKKLSSREGVEYTLEGLLKDGVSLVEQSMQSTFKGDASQLKQTAAQIACGAIRYFDLAHNRKSNYEFSFERVLSLKGNTAAYLLYAVTRLASLRTQFSQTYGLSGDATPSWNTCIAHVHASSGVDTVGSAWTPTERAVAFQILLFPEVLQQAADSLQPHALTDYLYTLATKFHLLYEESRIIPPRGSDKQDLRDYARRMQLCSLTDNTMRCGLALIGVNPVNRM